VVVQAGLLGGPVEGTGEQVVDQAEGGGLAPVEEHGADHGLHGIGQDRLLVGATGGRLATAEAQHVAKADPPTDVGQGAGADDAGADLGQLALGQVGVLAEQAGGDGEAEDGVAEELEPLIGAPLELGTPRPVGQRLGQQAGVGEPVSQPLDEGGRGDGSPFDVGRRRVDRISRDGP
jgi:hypothetical protein